MRLLGYTRIPFVYINWFECFDERGFKGGEMKSNTASDKNGKLVIVVFTCT